MIQFNKRLALLAKQNKLFDIYRLLAQYLLENKREEMTNMLLTGKIYGVDVDKEVFIKLLTNIKTGRMKLTTENNENT